jgi:hypothetical protein
MTTIKNIQALRLVFLLLCTATFLSCDNDYETIFADSPDERVQQALDEYNTLITDAPNGWRGMLYTGTGAGYFYYFKFDSEGKVSMISDFNEQTASESMTGSWMIKALQKPTLTFDTYSYIHLPADPDGDVNGGGNGQGLISDFEFTFSETNGDSVFMRGLKHNTELVLVRATGEESESILNQQILTILQSTKQYTADNKGLRLLLPDDTILPLAIDVSHKLFGVQHLSADGSAIETFISPFTFSIEGIQLRDTLTIGGYDIRTLKWDVNNNVYTIQLDDETPLFNSTEPLTFTPSTPLHAVVGTEFTTIHIPANPEVNRLPGQSDQFVEAYNTATEELINSTLRITLHELNFVFNRLDKQVYFDVVISQTSDAGVTSYFLAEYIFDYTIDDSGILDLTPVSANENGQYISFELRLFLQRLENDKFTLHYHAGGFELIGGFYSQENPEFSFGGYLRK